MLKMLSKCLKVIYVSTQIKFARTECTFRLNFIAFLHWQFSHHRIWMAYNSYAYFWNDWQPSSSYKYLYRCLQYAINRTIKIRSFQQQGESLIHRICFSSNHYSVWTTLFLLYCFSISHSQLNLVMYLVACSFCLPQSESGVAIWSGILLCSTNSLPSAIRRLCWLGWVERSFCALMIVMTSHLLARNSDSL